MAALELMRSGSPLTPGIAVALLTGGGDKPYALGLSTELIEHGVRVDLIGSDALDCPELRGKPGLNFLNLRGDQQHDASLGQKICRVLRYYSKLVGYAAGSKPSIFHILWPNKFQSFDRTLLLLYYKFLGKRIVLTAHDVNQSKMHGCDNRFNQITLRIQYHLADHVFVHTKEARAELVKDFGVDQAQITVVPFGTNKYVPTTNITPLQAKRRLGLKEGERAILFFGRIAPYKGLEYLCSAFRLIATQRNKYKLIIAGSPDLYEDYWRVVVKEIRDYVQRGRILLRTEFIPDEQAEIYFKAADVLVLPYRQVYQSGVLLLARRFGLPVLAANVGSLRDDVIEGKTGLLFKPEDPMDMAAAIERYFTGDLFAFLNIRRQEVQDYAAERHSWDVVGRMTLKVYTGLLRFPAHVNVSDH